MNLLADWQPASLCSFKLKDEVHVWRISFEHLSGNVPRLRNILSADEILRADKFHFNKDRLAFIAAHGYLRLLLARYLEVKPQELIFAEGEHGKPYLKNHTIEFNLSHSNFMGLLAFDAASAVGIDIEWMRPDFGGLKIARRFFSPTEVQELSALEGTIQIEGFFNGWSRKEAYIKALGRGLSLPLHQFSVSLTPGQPACLKNTAHDPRAAERWQLFAIEAAAEYKAALVASKRRKIIKLYEVDHIWLSNY